MKSIGEIISEARAKKKYSYYELEEITKIKSSFIEAVEKENWNILPPFPTVMGFVKSISSALNIDEKMIVAFLKRDYPPRKTDVNPKPDISAKPTWGPRLTFALGLGLVIVSILGYLIFQYIKFTSPPKINIVSPGVDQEIFGNYVLVFGSTDRDVKITVDNQPVLVDEDGKFSVSIEIVPTTSEIVVKAVSRSGKETVVERNIRVQSNN